MGLLLPVLVCIVVFVLPCLVVASSIRRGPCATTPVSKEKRAPVTDRWWFKVCSKLTVPFAGFAFLALLVRNIQNGIDWSGGSWAVIVPLGVVLSVVLLSKIGWPPTPIIEGSPPRPPWLIVLGKTAAKFLTVVASGFVVYELVAISLGTWPVLDTSLNATGLKEFAIALRQDARIEIAGLAVLFVLLYWQTNTVTRPEYVRPDGTPLAGAPYVIASAAYTGSRRSPGRFRTLLLLAVLAAAILFIIGRTGLTVRSDQWRWPIRLADTNREPNSLPPARQQSPMQWSRGIEYLPVSQLIYHRPDSFIQELSRERYQLDGTIARVTLANWTPIYPPDDIAAAADIVPVTFDNDHVFVVDCANPPLIRDTTVWMIARQLQLFPGVPVATTNCRPFQAAGSGLVYFYARFRR
jgi:hypothetical protein